MIREYYRPRSIHDRLLERELHITKDRQMDSGHSKLISDKIFDPQRKDSIRDMIYQSEKNK